MPFPSHDHSPPSQSREQDLVFITISQPDHLRHQDTQKKIRHHVMSQVGRSRKKKPKFLTVALELTANADDAATSIVDNESAANSQQKTIISRPLFPYGIYAVDPTPRARELIHFSTPHE